MVEEGLTGLVTCVTSKAMRTAKERGVPLEERDLNSQSRSSLSWGAGCMSPEVCETFWRPLTRLTSFPEISESRKLAGFPVTNRTHVNYSVEFPRRRGQTCARPSFHTPRIEWSGGSLQLLWSQERVVGISWGTRPAELHWQLFSGSSRSNKYAEMHMWHITGGGWMKILFGHLPNHGKLLVAPVTDPLISALCNAFEMSPITGWSFDSDLALWLSSANRIWWKCVPFLSLSSRGLTAFHSVFNSSDILVQDNLLGSEKPGEGEMTCFCWATLIPANLLTC